MPIGPVGSRQQEIANIEQLIMQKAQPKVGTQVANELVQSYGKYMDAHPTLDPKQGLIAWFLVTSKLPNKLGHDIAIALGSAGQLSKDAGQAIGATFGKFDIFNGINFGNWLMRGGEILIGLVLIGVGVAKITGTQNIISKIAKVPL